MSKRLGILMAKNNLNDIEVYSRKLDELYENNDVCNIAVTGPYDSGKSSVLQTYFLNKEKSYPWYIRIWNNCIRWLLGKTRNSFIIRNIPIEVKNYKFINVPNFFISKGKDDNDLSIETELEKKIIEQLLYSTIPAHYPKSKIKRIGRHGSFVKFMMFIIFIIASLYCAVSLGLLKIPIKLYDINFITAVSLIFVIFMLTMFTWRIYDQVISPNIWNVSAKNETKFPNIEVALKEDKTTNLFNLFGDELIYYFKKSRIKTIIFEDIDRFDSPRIFQELRELNHNINANRENNIKFIYVLKDSVFKDLKSNSDKSNERASDLKNKFFDYVLPIFPEHSYSNSKHTFDIYAEKCPTFQKISEKYIWGVGNYIHDTRTINTIVSEWDTYYKVLEKEETKIDVNKLFGMIVYKNVYPDDFDLISKGKSNLDVLFLSKFEIIKSLVDKKRENIDKQLEKVNLYLNLSSEQPIKDIRTLMDIRFKQLFKGEFTRGTIRFGRSDYKDYESEEDFFRTALSYNDEVLIYGYNLKDSINTVKDIYVYPEEKQIFSDFFNGNIINTAEIEKIKDEKYELEEKLKELQQKINKYNMSELLQEGEKVVPFLNNNSLLINNGVSRYLLINRLIEDDYYEYVSPTLFKTLNVSDSSFVKDVISNNFPQNKELNNPEEVEKMIERANGNFAYAYSPQLFNLFIVEGKQKEAHDLFNSVLLKNDCSFIMDAFMIAENTNSIISYLLKMNSSLLAKIFSKIDVLQKRYVSNIILNFLDLRNDQGKDLFNLIVDKEIIEEENFKLQFVKYLTDSENTATMLLDIYNYQFPNINFAAPEKRVFNKVIKKNWYKQNEINIKVIFKVYGIVNLDNIKTIVNNGLLSYEYICKYTKFQLDILQSSEKLTSDEIIKIIEFYLGEYRESQITSEILQKNQKLLLKFYRKVTMEDNLTNEEKEKVFTKLDINIEKLSGKEIEALIKEKKFPYLSNLLQSMLIRRKEISNIIDYINQYKKIDRNTVIRTMWKSDSEYLFEYLDNLSNISDDLRILLNIEDFNLTTIDCKDSLLYKIASKLNDADEILQVMENQNWKNIENKIKLFELGITEFPKAISRQQYDQFLFEQPVMEKWVIAGNRINMINKPVDGLNLLLRILAKHGIVNIKSKNRFSVYKKINNYIL
ncbi:hypothetical protein LMB63_01045 [Limosilactobacillus reuteri]|uniref:YobI family P-loop NTPase n=1 Tax=Limosilactobacillus reuteri TaxID=1598 RepID=UPI0015FD128B|nr:hypothetical protein [Limosilactobacillus reuteri]MBB1072465.1 hypothetical protein [Limosilactobacillus reuteri]MCC4509955.1 hypothetical protein [Limosilactobacillus reuteri]MCC4513574.1 hypothetical protein [Limosilactobacillus reuteri]